ncbi:MAG: sigma-70 family RNA polymerase sigma factor [Planctomycetes bacterium]|nr:sigma-70 family RNA polymerase sigma factor [Planctomycetota bacterium]
MTSSWPPSHSHQVLAQHVAGLRALARALVADEQSAEDLLHETYLRAAGAHAPRGDLRSWLARILRNLVHSQRRGDRRRARREERCAPHEASEPAAVDLAGRRELLEQVTRAVLELEAGQRDAVLLCFFEGRRQDEAARELGLSDDALRYRLRRALAALRKRLDGTWGDRREAWSAPLGALLGLELAGKAPLTAIGIGGGLVMKKVLVAMAAVLMLVLGILWWSRAQWPIGSPLPATLATTHDPSREVSASKAASEIVLRTELDPVAAAPTQEAASVAERFELRGRVISARRFPVSDAEVTCYRDEERVGALRTDTAGRFVLELAPIAAEELGVLSFHAQHPEHGAGLAHLDPVLLREGYAHQAEIQLEPLYASSILVLDGERAVPGAELVLRRIPERAETPQVAALLHSDGDGRASLPALPRGSYAVRAWVAGSRGGFARLDLPRASSGDLVVPIDATRALEVEVVDRESGTPIVGAEVRVEALASQPGVLIGVGSCASPRASTTDETGHCSFALIDSEPYSLQVSARAAGYQPVRGWKSEYCARSVGQVRFALARTVTLSWPIVEDELPVPADGTLLRFHVRDHYPTSGTVILPARIEDRRLVVPGLETGGRMRPGRRAGVATLPGGAVGVCRYLPDEGDGEPVRFRRARNLTVRLRDRSGRPVSSVSIGYRDWWGTIPESALSDAQGVARLGGLAGGKIEVSASLSTDSWSLGEHSLEEGDLELEHVIGNALLARIELRIDGARRLPASYRLDVAQARMKVLGEDPATGSVSLQLHPVDESSEILLAVHAPGFRAARTRIGPPHPTQAIERTIELVPNCDLLVRVSPPSDGRYRLGLHQRDVRNGGWRAHRPTVLEARDDHRLRFEDLGPGVYRVRDQLSGALSGDIELANDASMRHGELAFDLSKAGEVEGRVVLPPQSAPSHLILERRAPGLDPDEVIGEDRVLRVPIHHEGRFRSRVPGDRPVVFRALHASLIPDPERGRVEVTSPRRDVELHMIEGPRIRFRTSFELPENFVQVMVYRAPRWRVSLPEVIAKKSGSEWWMGGLEPGRYDFFLDVHDAAPIWLRDVEVAFPETDLGTLTRSAGGSVLVNWSSAPASGVNRRAWVERWEGPYYSRGPQDPEARQQRITGLLAGPHQLVIDAGSGDGERRLPIVLDGRSELVIQADGR